MVVPALVVHEIAGTTFGLLSPISVHYCTNYRLVDDVNPFVQKPNPPLFTVQTTFCSHTARNSKERTYGVSTRTPRPAGRSKSTGFGRVRRQPEVGRAEAAGRRRTGGPVESTAGTGARWRSMCAAAHVYMHTHDVGS